MYNIYIYIYIINTNNISFKSLQYECEFNEKHSCFNKSANVLYTEQARELAESGNMEKEGEESWRNEDGSIDEAKRQAEIASKQLEQGSQAFENWVN